VIRVDAVWLAVEPLDMRAGTETALARVVSGRFVWPRDSGGPLTLTRAQLDALVLGLPWQRIGEAGIITLL
jgi:transposase